MFDRIKKLFGKKKEKRNEFEGLRVDLVTYVPVEAELLPIKKVVTAPDFENMEFESELGDYNLSSLSDGAKAKIIEIIKEDEQLRAQRAISAAERAIDLSPLNNVSQLLR